MASKERSAEELAALREARRLRRKEKKKSKKRQAEQERQRQVASSGRGGGRGSGRGMGRRGRGSSRGRGTAGSSASSIGRKTGNVVERIAVANQDVGAIVGRKGARIRLALPRLAAPRGLPIILARVRTPDPSSRFPAAHSCREIRACGAYVKIHDEQIGCATRELYIKGTARAGSAQLRLPSIGGEYLAAAA